MGSYCQFSTQSYVRIPYIMAALFANIKNAAMDVAKDAGNSVLADAVAGASSVDALKQGGPAEHVADAEDHADGLSPPVQGAIRAENTAVESALCALLKNLFALNTEKYSTMMEARVKAHLEEGAVVDNMNRVINDALTPKIQAALTAAIDEMKTTKVYQNLLETHVNAVFSTDIRKILFDNLNALSDETRASLFKNAVAKEPGITRSALTSEGPSLDQTPPPVSSRLPVAPPIVGASSRAAPVEDPTIGGARRRRKTRARRGAKKGGAKKGGAKSRRQRVLVLA